jgi:hypothetical protein
VQPHHRIEIPIRLLSEANNFDHWTKKHARKKAQNILIRMEWAKLPVLKPPVTIKLIRQGKRVVDEDNLIGGVFKSVRDCIANILIPNLAPGQADSSPLITWQYDQQIAKSYALIIEIYKLSESSNFVPNNQKMS